MPTAKHFHMPKPWTQKSVLCIPPLLQTADAVQRTKIQSLNTTSGKTCGTFSMHCTLSGSAAARAMNAAQAHLVLCSTRLRTANHVRKECMNPIQAAPSALPVQKVLQRPHQSRQQLMLAKSVVQGLFKLSKVGSAHRATRERTTPTPKRLGTFLMAATNAT